MKRLITIVLAITIGISFFAFLSAAILNIKMLELKNRLAKSQILNYEFSSVALKTKFKDLLGSSENYQKEIQSNILESGIISGKKIDSRYSLTWDEYIGLAVVNTVRKLSLKPFLNFLDDTDYINLLHYAFLLERNQRFNQAAQKYSELESKVQSEDKAFVFLHSAYCKAVIGEYKESIEKLKYIISNFSGTHFSENSEILLTILQEAELRTQDMKDIYKDPYQLARALFHSGRYKESLVEFSKLSDLSDSDKYIKARSLEKIGNLQEAIADYYFLTENARDQEVAKAANRRLLMLGKIYDAGENLAKIAEQKAIELHDEKFSESVKEGAEMKLKPSFHTPENHSDVENRNPIEASLSSAKEMEIALPAKMTGQILEKPKESPRQRKEQLSNHSPAFKKKLDLEAPIPPFPVKKNTAKKLNILLSDGRTMKGKSIKITGSEILVETKSYKMSFPYSMLERVSIEGDDADSLEYLVGGNSIEKAEILEKKDDEIKISRQGKTVSIPAEKLGEVRIADE
ncbi:MAG: hypothetical protein IT569_06795 [Leptospiraceae bacterium]|nr:hypothetical protein [Leptospiraceae bacterium]